MIIEIELQMLASSLFLMLTFGTRNVLFFSLRLIHCPNSGHMMSWIPCGYGMRTPITTANVFAQFEAQFAQKCHSCSCLDRQSQRFTYAMDFAPNPNCSNSRQWILCFFFHWINISSRAFIFFLHRLANLRRPNAGQNTSSRQTKCVTQTPMSFAYSRHPVHCSL